MIISIVSAKGGTGKTTLTSYLYKELIQQGHKVALVDLDGQDNLTSYFSEEKDKNGNTIEVKGKDDLLNLRDMEFYNDFILIDCPPKMEKSVSVAMYFSDVIIIPIRPDNFFMNVLKRTEEQIRLSQSKARNVYVITALNKQRTLHKEILETVKKRCDPIVVPLSGSWEDSYVLHERLSKKSPCRKPLEELINRIKEN